LKTLELWLRNEPLGFWRTLNWVLWFTLFSLAYTQTILFFYWLLGIELTPHLSPNYLSNSMFNWAIIRFLLNIFNVALIEELMFRFLPLSFVLLFCRNRFIWVILAMIASSAIFGYLHGGLQFIGIQGVGGIFLSIIFLKCGGMNFNFVKATICSTAMHFLYNCAILLPVYKMFFP
jgi:membrane protease YdiL (CAAX protease family)